MMKLTPTEQEEIANQLLLTGQLVGLSWRINGPLLKKWLDIEKAEQENHDPLKESPDTFRYGKQVLAAIKFAEDARP